MVIVFIKVKVDIENLVKIDYIILKMIGHLKKLHQKKLNYLIKQLFMKYIKNTYYFVEYSFDNFIVYNIKDSEEEIEGVPMRIKNGKIGNKQPLFSFTNHRLADYHEIQYFEAVKGGLKSSFEDFKLNMYEILY